MSIFQKAVKFTVLATLCVTAVACTSSNVKQIAEESPDQRLDKLMALYRNVQDLGDGCHEIWSSQRAAVDCQRIMSEVERLHLQFPSHDRIILSNAIIRMDMGQPENAQSLLDQLMLFQRAYPEAAILRAEIAIREGNLNFAEDLIERQVLLTPDNSGLREIAASIAYLQSDYVQARQSLSIAGRLGAPGWRLSYHHGLVSEVQQDWGQACEFYMMSLDQKPDFQSSLSRLIGLIDQPECEEGVRYIR